MHSGASADFYRMPDVPGRAWIVHRASPVPASRTLAAVSSPSFDPAQVVLLDGDPSDQGQSDQTRPPFAEPVLRDGLNRVTIRTVLNAPGYLVLADTWYPGWQARVDGEPTALLRANHAFRAVQLTAGEHVVEMVYRPTSVLVGAAASVATLGLILLSLIVRPRKRP